MTAIKPYEFCPYLTFWKNQLNPQSHINQQYLVSRWMLTYYIGRAHRSHRWGHWFESSTDHTGKPTPSGWVFSWAAPASHQCPIDALSASIGRGAEALPVADEARRKRSEQQVMRAAAKQDADCELDRTSEAK